jgi:hypothetical protein
MQHDDGVKEAFEEIKSKTYQQIEQETGKKWGDRACACFWFASLEPDGPKLKFWLMEAEAYKEEAIEHAAKAQDLDFKTLREVSEKIQKYQSLTEMGDVK